MAGWVCHVALADVASLASTHGCTGMQLRLTCFPSAVSSAVEKAVHSMFDYLERTTCIPYPAPAEPAKPTEPAAPVAAASPSAALVRPCSPKLLLSFGVAQVSLLWLVSGA